MRWIIGAALLLVLTGCAGEAAPAEKTGTGEVRHDLEPLTERFPQLAAAESATWLSGRYGSDSAPGPSLYWIDAVVVLSETEYLALASAHDLEDASAPETDLDLPAGPLLRADELDDAFSQDEFRSDVYLDDASRSLVLLTTFE